jgi:hypothetical protein
MRVARILLGGIIGASACAAFAQVANTPPWSQQNPMTDTAIGGEPATGSQSGPPAANNTGAGKTRAQVSHELSDFRGTGAARRMDELYHGAGN